MTDRGSTTRAESARSSRGLRLTLGRAWTFVVVAKATVLVAALITGQWTEPAVRVFPAWAQLLEAAVFGTGGVLLVGWGRADFRAWILGGYLLDTACSLVETLVEQHPGAGASALFAAGLRTDAFQAAALWLFASEFPNPPQQAWMRRLFSAGFFAALALGVFLVATNSVTLRTWQVVSEDVARRFLRHPPVVDAFWFWSVQYALTAPALMLMPLKVRELGSDDRRRFNLLRFGVVAAFSPIAVDVCLRTIFPAWNRVASQDPLRTVLGVVVFGSLAIAPLSATYAALVQRALEVRFVVRSALQYVLARESTRALTVAPLMALLALAYFNRDSSVRDLFSGASALVLLALAALGVVGISSSEHLLRTIDARFFRDQSTARDILEALASALRRARTVDELVELTTKEIARALKPSRIGFALAEEDETLHLQDRNAPGLARSSLLAQLLARSDTPLEIDLDSSSVWTRLSDGEQQWLAAGGGRLVVPLRGLSGKLIGALVLGEKKSELPYLADDRTLLAAVGLALSHALDRLLNGAETDGKLSGAPPALECVECGAVVDRTLAVCGCGGPLKDAALPQLVAERLLVSQRIGAGGMGIVYLASDIRLHQFRAIKTLPRMEVALMGRLRREARAMAAVSHPHLATLHGLEVWRGKPLLVMEYLEGGTLADRIRRGPIAASIAVSAAASVASALSALHEAGVIHGDVKPSNIGFTAGAQPKLFDFGLARLVPATHGAGVAQGLTTWSISTSDARAALRGTPAYLSPEVLGGEAASFEDDLWGLSVTLLEAVTGINPYRADTPAATVGRVLNTDVTALVDILPVHRRSAMTRLLSRDRTQRPRTAADWIAATAVFGD